jgi:3-phosphoshikimate 1-carboxyvinyltransferase
MTYRCTPVAHPFRASVQVPGSKSVANRALVCAALSVGDSVLENIPNGDDTEAMLAGLIALGLDVQQAGSQVSIRRDGSLQTATIHAGLAGTTSRFLTAVAATSDNEVLLDGHERLRNRPFGPLIDALRSLGATLHDQEGGLPLRIQGPLHGNELEIDATMSSQFISALMMIAPTLPHGLRIGLRGQLVSRPYVDLTASVMESFGVTARVSDSEIYIAEQTYRPTSLFIEPDASSASYPLAIAAVTGSTVVLEGFGSSSRQGDAKISEILKLMGASVVVSPELTELSGNSSRELRGIDIDMADISDLVPTVAVLATLASSASRIRGVGFIREKESDRIGDLARELKKCGADITEHPDGLEIFPAQLHGSVVKTYEDHRLAMAFSILGSRVPGVEILDPNVVTKSWPSFWSVLDDLVQHE